MAERRRGKRSTDKPAYLFVQESPSTARTVNLRQVSRQARKWTSSRKQTDLRASAQQRASYARSLVGWERSSTLRGAPDHAASTPDDQGLASPRVTMGDVCGGLRVDPFNALPVDQTRPVMDVTDYCEPTAPLPPPHGCTDKAKSSTYGHSSKPPISIPCSGTTRTSSCTGHWHYRMSC